MSGELRLSRTERTVMVADFSGLPLLWLLVVGRQFGSLLTMTPTALWALHPDKQSLGQRAQNLGQEVSQSVCVLTRTPQ